MSDLNRVLMIGRLTRDGELKNLSGGSTVMKFSLAVNRRAKSDGGWGDEVSYFDCTLWGKQAESLQQYMVKGKQVGIDGELRQSRWEQDGQKRSKVEITVYSIQLLGGNSATKAEDDIPF